VNEIALGVVLSGTTVNEATADFVPYQNINCMLSYFICLQRTEMKNCVYLSVGNVNALC
jgi:hypothetical protein